MQTFFANNKTELEHIAELLMYYLMSKNLKQNVTFSKYNWYSVQKQITINVLHCICSISTKTTLPS